MTTEPRPARRIDLVSLVAGLVVVVLCLAFTFGDLDTFHAQARVVWPTVLLGLGAGLVASGRRG